MHFARGTSSRIVLLLMAGCLIVVLPTVFELPTASMYSPSSLEVFGSDSFCGPSERVNEDPGGARQNDPSIALDRSGGAYVVWSDLRNVSPRIYFSYRPPGGGWTPDVEVTDALAAGSWNPDITVDLDGNAYALWADVRRDSNRDIYSSDRPAGGSWGPNVKVNDDVGYAVQGNPSVAVDCAGNVYAVWLDKREPHDYNIYFSYRPARGPWGPNERVNDDYEGRLPQSAPSIAVDCEGNAYAVWCDERDWYNSDIYFSFRPVGGSWGPNVMVNDAAENSQCLPSIAVDSGGNAYAAWRDYREPSRDPHAYFSYRRNRGTWGPNARLDDRYGWRVVDDPSIAVGPRGPAYAVWKDARNSGKGDIYLSYGGGRGTWARNLRVSDNMSEVYVWHSSVVVGDAGGAYVVWEEERDGDDSDIFFALCWPKRIHFPLAAR